MTSLPSSSRSIRSVSLLPLLMAAIPMLLAVACADKHIGRPCVVSSTLPTDPSIAAVNTQALECPSRICILPAQEMTLDSTPPTGPLCTDYCSSDDDCADGERRAKGDLTSTRCIAGFACRTPIGHLETNPLSCKQVCVCKDFLKADSATKPKSCP